MTSTSPHIHSSQRLIAIAAQMIATKQTKSGVRGCSGQHRGGRVHGGVCRHGFEYHLRRTYRDCHDDRSDQDLSGAYRRRRLEGRGRRNLCHPAVWTLPTVHRRHAHRQHHRDPGHPEPRCGGAVVSTPAVSQLVDETTRQHLSLTPHQRGRSGATIRVVPSRGTTVAWRRTGQNHSLLLQGLDPGRPIFRACTSDVP